MLLKGIPLSQTDWHDCLERWIYGHYHEWFLLMIAGIYLILPFIQKICTTQRLMRYFLVLWVVNAFVLPLMPWAEGVTSKLGLHFPVGYVGYFVLGYYLSVTEFSKKNRVILYLLGIVSLCYTVFATIFESERISGRVDTHFGNFTFNILLMSVAFFVFFQHQIWIRDSQEK